jgi:hypothetical protein
VTPIAKKNKEPTEEVMNKNRRNIDYFRLAWLPLEQA